MTLYNRQWDFWVDSRNGCSTGYENGDLDAKQAVQIRLPFDTQINVMVGTVNDVWTAWTLDTIIPRGH